MRVQRDIPSHLILAGVKKSNLRQLATERLKQQGGRCQCIRCREVGHRLAVDNVKPDLKKSRFRASATTLRKAKKFSFQRKTGKTTFCSATCGCVFPLRRLTDPKSPPSHPPLFGNFTFTVRLCLSGSIRRARGSIGVSALTCLGKPSAWRATISVSKSF